MANPPPTTLGRDARLLRDTLATRDRALGARNLQLLGACTERIRQLTADRRPTVADAIARVTVEHISTGRRGTLMFVGPRAGRVVLQLLGHTNGRPYHLQCRVDDVFIPQPDPKEQP